ncbi:MAG: nicotinate-nucleotide--dimethylbenzimidazole phosphoribosyltransferase [Lachnospiraceae bacterium]|nr:nicotinate-nucleotide--dimethylbenzimidazole phosphoribosyltransferase [Lachnospiraceae bacterium]
MTLDELLEIKIEKPDRRIYDAAKDRWNRIAKPLDSLGAFEDLLCRIAAVQQTLLPSIKKKALIVMCADNGIVAEGVSQSGQEVTAMVAALMGEHKSSVGMLAKDYPMEYMVYDVGMVCEQTPAGVIDQKVCHGTKDFLKEPAMSQEQCLQAIQTGMDAVKKCRDMGIELLATGEMGIGNTTTSTALLCALCGISAQECTGRGAGLSNAGLKRKIDVISEGLRLHIGNGHPDGIRKPQEVFRALCCLGGADIAALTGVFIGGGLYRIPVVIDGLISAVAALAAERLLSGCADYMIASHRGREKGMDTVRAELSLQPVIHADMALGEGTGAVMLFPLLDMVFSLYGAGTAFRDTPIGQYERHDA